MLRVKWVNGINGVSVNGNAIGSDTKSMGRPEDKARDESVPSARHVVMSVMLLGLLSISLVQGLSRSPFLQGAQPLGPDKGGEIAKKIRAEAEQLDKGGRLLVLLSDYDFRDLAYTAYHNPALQWDQPKLPHPSPDKLIPIEHKGRQIVVVNSHDIIDLWRDGNNRAIEVERDAKASGGVPFNRILLITWRATADLESIRIILYDSTGRTMLKDE